MTEILLIVALVLLAGMLALQIVLLLRKSDRGMSRLQAHLDALHGARQEAEGALRDELARARELYERSAELQRQIFSADVSTLTGSMRDGLARAEQVVREEAGHTRDIADRSAKAQRQAAAQSAAAIGESLEHGLARAEAATGQAKDAICGAVAQGRESASREARQHHQALTEAMAGLKDGVLQSVADLAARQDKQLDQLCRQEAEAAVRQQQQIGQVDQHLQAALSDLRREQTQSLEQLRAALETEFARVMNSALAGSIDRLDCKLADLGTSLSRVNDLIERRTRPKWQGLRERLERSGRRSALRWRKLNRDVGDWAAERLRKGRAGTEKLARWLRSGKLPKRCQRSAGRAARAAGHGVMRTWSALVGLGKKLRRRKTRKAGDDTKSPPAGAVSGSAVS